MPDERDDRQRTKEGMVIPVPAKEAFMDALEKTAKPVGRKRFRPRRAKKRPK